MIDRDIAQLFGIPTKRINEMLKRNVNRFPDYYFFRLTEIEKSELVANCDRLGKLKHSSHPPIAFTEYGVSMLATLAKSEIAAQISINIIDAFIRMKHAENHGKVLSMEIHQPFALNQKMNRLDTPALKNARIHTCCHNKISDILYKEWEDECR